MSGHVILCGLGHVGLRVADLLVRLGEQVVVVTQGGDEERLRRAREAGVRVLLGDARDARRLEEAGVATARAVIAATHSDITNVEIVLDARRARPDIAIVARLFDQNLARSFERDFEVRRALGMSLLAAPRFAAAALGADVLTSFAVEGEQLVVAELPASATPARGAVISRHGERATFVLPGGAALGPGESPRATPPRRARPRLALAIWRDAPRPLRLALTALLVFVALSVVLFRALMHLDFVDALYFIITTVTTTGYGDITPRDHGALLKLYACLVMLLGSCTMAVFFSFITDFVVGERFRRLAGRRPVPEGGHVVVAGLGNLGYRVVEALDEAGVEVAAVDLDTAGPFNSEVAARSALVLGDARLRGILQAAGIERARGVVATTGDDAVNLAVGLHARELNPRARTVVRLFDADLSRKVEQGLRLDAALSASLLAAPTFAAAALFEGVRTAFVEADELVALCLHTVTADEASATSGSPAALAARGLEPLLRLEQARVPPGAPARLLAAPLGTAPLLAGDRLLVARRRPLARG